MSAPKVQLEVPSYAQAKELVVEVQVVGDDGRHLLHALGVSAEDVHARETANGPAVFTAKVRPFAALSGSAYAKWVSDLLREKLSQHWWHRW